MLHPSDLRINNVIQYNGELLTVHSYDFANLDWSKAEGIGLTGEILGKCGFVWNESLNHWVHDVVSPEFIKYNNSYGAFMWQRSAGRYREIKYLHRLQNIMHALTGEEIQVNL
jgi:hypothetical protein